jgi:hypothetical protein
MYANGDPPSYMHLGRAESWVPIPTNAIDNPNYENGNAGKIHTLHDNWRLAALAQLSEVERWRRPFEHEAARGRARDQRAACPHPGGAISSPAVVDDDAT